MPKDRMEFKIENPEQSKALQEILFRFGYKWKYGNNYTVRYSDKKYIQIADDCELTWSAMQSCDNHLLVDTAKFITDYAITTKNFKNAFWGFHLMLDCSGCDLKAVRSYNNIELFLDTLVKAIDMVAVGRPNIQYLCENDPKEGWTAMQMISTSSIVAHFMNTGSCYIDIFSCKEFDIETAKKVVKKFFLPNKIRVNYLTRDAN